ncbi:purine-nucleoside phosphorylase [Anaeromyxobacter paludicola]|uniref:Purine nucleoside phosphorylase n=1 Tax=Anaeromyxobacter paludicola TaxID=2918171 RepID=A0ABM7XB53_9BACT|nr:purine-nucleoside phosphorylase [Anaeromyxobacter paludicola]BDG09050.1 purine nucleoside phosphorylase [Anaeromyxobacter paludicola]
MKADLSTKLAYALAWTRGKLDVTPAVGVVLGSGLGALADRLERQVAIPYEEIPGMPVSRVAGHAGRLVVGELPGPAGPVPVAAMQGRVHAYEGWSPGEVVFGVRVLCGLGARALVLTNAAGAVDPALAPGDLVRITDHLNLSGHNPLVGPNDERIGPRFPDLSQAYDPALAAKLDACAARLGAGLKQGVYACLLGPSYETPAEIRMLRTLGADVVGMSTVPEVIAARHMGVPVCAVSLVSNLAAGLGARPLSHGEVQAIASRESARFVELLAAFLPEAAA